MPIGSALDKRKESMELMQLDEMLRDLVSITNRTKPGQVTHKIADIKDYVKEELRLQRQATIASEREDFYEKLLLATVSSDSGKAFRELLEEYSPSLENKEEEHA
jgi:hypothetical protein